VSDGSDSPEAEDYSGQRDLSSVARRAPLNAKKHFDGKRSAWQPCQGWLACSYHDDGRRVKSQTGSY